MFKKGEKSLQMIFGLFILLIISLVVLSLFFKFMQGGTEKLEGELSSYESQAAIEECKLLCNKIQDDNSAIEFCKKTLAVDWNNDKILTGQKASYGKWDFCEDKIPCFIYEDNCKGTYDAATCRNLLKTYRESTDYKKVFEDGPGSCVLSNTENNWYTSARTGAIGSDSGQEGSCPAGQIENPLIPGQCLDPNELEGLKI